MILRNIPHFLQTSGEWRRIGFVYDVIGNIAGINKR